MKEQMELATKTSPLLICACVYARARVFVRVCVLFDGYLLLAQIKLCG